MSISSSAMPHIAASAASGQQKGRRLNLWWLFAILLGVTVVVAIVRAWPETQGLLWLFAIPPLPAQVGQIASILAPLVAISTAIERTLETAFDWYEQSTRTAANILNGAEKNLDWIDEEYKNAYEAAKQAAATLGGSVTSTSLQGLQAAEDRLAKAEQRLRSWVDAPEYLAWKRALCIWFGLLAGLFIAVVGDLGIPSPRLLDMLVTGLVIGSGPGPMHSLIGILQGGKDALDNFNNLGKKGQPTDDEAD